MPSSSLSPRHTFKSAGSRAPPPASPVLDEETRRLRVARMMNEDQGQEDLEGAGLPTPFSVTASARKTGRTKAGSIQDSAGKPPPRQRAKRIAHILPEDSDAEESDQEPKHEDAKGAKPSTPPPYRSHPYTQEQPRTPEQARTPDGNNRTPERPRTPDPVLPHGTAVLEIPESDVETSDDDLVIRTPREDVDDIFSPGKKNPLKAVEASRGSPSKRAVVPVLPGSPLAASLKSRKKKRAAEDDGSDEDRDMTPGRQPLRSPTKRSRVVRDPSPTPVKPSRGFVTRMGKGKETSANRQGLSEISHDGLSSTSIMRGSPSKGNKKSEAGPPGFQPSFPLPEACQHLISLHQSLERTLLLHLATVSVPSPSKSSSRSARASASSSPQTEGNGSEQVILPNLLTLRSAKSAIERGSGKKFGLEELERLIWAWEGCGSISNHEDDSGKNSNRSRGGLGFLVTKTRELGEGGKKQMSTWGIGISLEVRTNPQLPTMELVDPYASNLSPKKRTSTNEGLGRSGMSVIALWSQGSDGRKEELTRRLENWVKTEHDKYLYQTSNDSLLQDSFNPFEGSPQTPQKRKTLPRPLPPSEPRNTQLATPPSTSRHQRTQDALAPTPTIGKRKLGPSAYLGSITSFPVPEIPRAELPSFQGQATPSASSPTKLKPQEPPLRSSSRIDLFEGLTQEKLESPKRVPSLKERIKAKEAASNASASSLLFPEAPGASSSVKLNAMKQRQQEELKRRSMLSRLPNVADGVAMLFSAAAFSPTSSTSPRSPSSSPSKKRKAIPLEEVANLICKSTKVSLSKGEALEGLNLLANLCPDFIHIKIIDKREWLAMSVSAVNKGTPSTSSTLKDAKKRIQEELAKPIPERV